MKIHFETALFGESNKAHSLLSSSDTQFARSLTAITDLPLELPNTAGQLPMLSGFPYAGRYVFLSSIRDIEASRGGMAKTFALIADKRTVGLINSIAAICANLGHERIPFITGSCIDIDFEAQTHSSPSSGTVALARTLMTNRSPHPVVWIGYDGFQEALAGVWSGLPAAIRQGFTFRFCCSPRDGRSKGINLIYTPTECKSRWRDHPSITSPFDDRPATNVEMLFADGPIRTDVLRWAMELGADITSFEQLRILAEAHAAFKSRPSLSDLDVTILCRNLARLVPDASKAADIKMAALAEVESRITKGSLDVISYLRNIPFTEFPSGDAIISRATAGRFKVALRDGEDIARLMREALEDRKRPWAIGLTTAFMDALRESRPAAVDLIWELMKGGVPDQAEEWLIHTSRLVPNLEAAMLKRRPPVGQSEGAVIASLCRLVNWPELHANVVGAIYSPQQAIAEQMSFAGANAAGLAELSRCIGSRTFVAAAVNCDSRALLLDQIVTNCIADIEILEQASVSHAGWRTVVCAVIKKARHLIDKADVLDDQVLVFWQLLCKGKVEDDEFVQALSETKYADLLDVKERPELWQLFSGPAKNAFLTATVGAWFERNSVRGQIARPETPLCDIILSTKYRDQLLPVIGAHAVIAAIQVFHTFSDLGPNDFDEWRIRLLTAQRPLSNSDSKMMGSLLASKGWTSCAHSLLTDYTNYHRHDLHPALCECSYAFTWMTRYRYSLPYEPITPDQWWEGVSGLLLDLYPEGPRDKNVWERCGGHLADLTTHGTGREQWTKVVAQLRNGAFLGGATIHSLIRTCRSDYYSNSDVVFLIDKCPFQLNLSELDSFVD